ncbi:Uncharacterised protein [uncultured archaeon]|nr:Uncharacterised protein [uncultured archaeon]
MAEDNSAPNVPTPVAFATKHKVLIGGLAVAVIILGLLSTILGYSYRKVTKLNVTLTTENDTLKKQINSHTETTTTSQPTFVGGHVAYTTTTHTTNDTSENTVATHNASVSIVTKTVTVTKRDFFMVGYGRNAYMDHCLLGQLGVSTPIGQVGIALAPDISYFKRSAAYLTWKP